MTNEQIYFNPGMVVRVKHDIENRPKMFVVEKVTRSIINKETNEKESVFLVIKCRCFDKNYDLQEAIYSTKDLEGC